MVKTIVHSLGFTLTTFKKFGSLLAAVVSLEPIILVLSTLCPREHQRPSDSRTRTTTSMRFDLKFFCIFSNYRHPGKLHCTFHQKKTLFIFWKELKPFQRRKMIKPLTLYNWFLYHDILTTTRSKMTMAILFFCQNDAGSCASPT